MLFHSFVNCNSNSAHRPSGSAQLCGHAQVSATSLERRRVLQGVGSGKKLQCPDSYFTAVSTSSAHSNSNSWRKRFPLRLVRGRSGQYLCRSKAPLHSEQSRDEAHAKAVRREFVRASCVRSVALGWYTGVVPPQCTIASPRIMILQQSQKADIRLRLAATLLLLPWVLVVLGAADAAADEAGVATSEAQKPGQTVAPEKPRVQGVEQSSMGGKFNSLLNKAKEKLFFQEPTPPIGSARLSYAKTLQLLNYRMIKRMTIMADGKLALVEVPIYMGGHDYDTQRYDQADFSALYAREFPEWRMEMFRYYVELPGDFWTESNLHSLIKQSLPHRTGDGYAKYEWITQGCQHVMEVTVIPPGEGYQWVAAYSNQVLLVLCLVLFRTVIGGIEWVLGVLGRLRGPQLSEKAKAMVEMSKSIATSFNVGDDNRSTGVRFEDVQGIEHVKDDIKEILEMLVGSERHTKNGARAPRGVLLEGPPGTGKTYLARAMATEAGVPFFSANGAEFVQMFQGIASARVKALFKDARENSPAIVFIDEVDAIGKARHKDGYRDLGSAEREQGLMQLLVEMDGFKPAEQVLVVAATNRREVLDEALLRAGRFDRTIFMGTPSPENRYQILKVHARDKQIPRDNDDILLRDAARKAAGYSGAELANMLNEAAILQIRYAKSEIDADILQEVMDKNRIGLPADSLPLSQAKRHLASVWAGRAVVATEVFGPDYIESVSLRIVGNVLGRLLYKPGSQWGKMRVDQGDFGMAVQLMVPLYAARATEEVLFGRDRATLSTAPEIAQAGQLARWLVVQSRINPALWSIPVPIDEYSPITQFVDRLLLEKLVLRFQTHAYHQALVIVHQRQTAIEALAEDLVTRPDATVTSERLNEVLAQDPEEVDDSVLDSLPFKSLIPETADPDLYIEHKDLIRAMGLIKGDLDPGMFFDKETMENLSKAYSKEPEEWFDKHKKRQAFASDEGADFPPAPDVKDRTVLVS